MQWQQLVLIEDGHRLIRTIEAVAVATPPTASACLSHVWDKTQARFNPCILPVIAAVPAVFGVIALVWKLLGLFGVWRLLWTQPFVVEVARPSVLDEVLPKRRWTPFVLLLAAISAVAFVLQLFAAALARGTLETIAPAASWLITLGIVLVYQPRTAPCALLVLHALQTICQSILLAGQISSDQVTRGLNIASVVCSALGFGAILVMPLRDPHLPSQDISRPLSEPTSSLRSPEDNLSLWQYMTVSWMTPMMRIGKKRQMQDEDVWQLAYEFQHDRLHDNFRLLRGTVVQRLIRANIIDILILVVLGIIALVLEYSTPLLLQKVLASMEDPASPKQATAIYAAISLAARMLDAQLSVFNLWHGRRCYERARGEMITMLYEKTLARQIRSGSGDQAQKTLENANENGHHVNGNGPKPNMPSLWTKAYQQIARVFRREKASAEVKEPASMGKILNLMRNDVYEVAQRFWEIESLVKMPLSIIFSVTLVVYLLGLPSLLAILVVFIAQVINFGLARVLVILQKRRRKATDRKLQIISQFIEAIRHLRWYGWQGAWLSRIMTARQKELNLRVISNVWNLLLHFCNTFSLEMTQVVAFYSYTVLAGKPLTVDLAFPAIDVLQMLTVSLRELPQLIIVMINAWVAVGRIEDFMAEPDLQKTNTEALAGDEMGLDNASFAWPGSTDAVLGDINLSFPPGLTIICGQVAAGKTALLQALLGELDMLDGQLIRPNEPIAYCAQTPWLQSMSIRDNILFGSVYEDQRYKEVIASCALTPDLLEFKAADLTLLGENGIGLSGGQRARVALARAVYSQAKIVLLDDPLSALDQETAESIVKMLLSGPLMATRTVVLVTHRTDLVVGIAEQMIKIDNGRASVVDISEAAEDLQRIMSTQSKEERDARLLAEQKAAAVPEKFIEDEHREHGGVQAVVYWEYIKAGKLRWWFALAVVLLFWRVAFYGELWLLKTWGEDSSTVRAAWDPTDRLPDPKTHIKLWLLVFFFFALAICLSWVLTQAIMVIIMYNVGKSMFTTVMERVTGATFRFFDVTPIGRLMNRMTSDISVIDGNLSNRLQAMTSLTISWLSAVLIIATVTPPFLAFGIAMVLAYVFIFSQFLPTSQSLRRLEMVSLTPLMSNFGTLLTGLSTVRAFRAQRQFQDGVVRVVDTFQKMDHFYWSLQAWLMYRFDVLSAIATFLMTVLALATNLSAGLTAFVLLAAERFVNSTHRMCKQYGQLQMEFVSVERVVELTHLEQEPKGDVAPPAWWPSFGGDITFDNVTIRYAPHLDPALSAISFTVKGGSKTAVIGRTGSGKSTLALSLLATVLPEAGQIFIDKIDLAHVDKQLLRTRVTFLAQDPVLFPGTMRQNLDPIEEHSDDECSLVLDRVCARQGWSLDTRIEGGGRNLSQGQRQLVGLARAVLRRSAIIILDEATASIDRDTARQIQQVMLEEMRESTVITIAHRLEAVQDADYCIVLGKGRVLQQGPAAEMLAKYENDMVDDAYRDGGQD